jgi:mycofactocin precursor
MDSTVLEVAATDTTELDELDDLLEDELLVEEVSIDGMCGVY